VQQHGEPTPRPDLAEPRLDLGAVVVRPDALPVRDRLLKEDGDGLVRASQRFGVTLA
jgi:hypothetical protein